MDNIKITIFTRGDFLYSRRTRSQRVLSFAAMDETEINGVYVFDYMNLHSIVGNGMLVANLRKLQWKGNDNSYIIIDLTADRLALKPTYDSQYKTVEFDRVI